MPIYGASQNEVDAGYIPWIYVDGQAVFQCYDAMDSVGNQEKGL